MKAIFDNHGADTTLDGRSGQVVTILRELTKDEADINDVGKMYKVKFSDGYITYAFDDELEFIKED